MVPLVAIVGRPNVGKSTLFNRLVGKPLAIVFDQPGVTRDRHYADVHALGRTFTVIDTGGFDPNDTDAIGQGIARHVRAAVEEADVVLCVLDGLNPPTSADLEATRLLRRSNKPVIYVANRVDHQAHEAMIGELCTLGIDVVPISALHGRGVGRLCELLVDQLPPLAEGEVAEAPIEDDADDVVDDDDDAEANFDENEEAPAAPLTVPRVALIGRPNAGKSSLLNRLSGAERSLVDDRPGTTRDPIDVELEYKGRRYVVVDTAGIRRRSKVDEGVEAQSVMRALKTVERADVVVVLCDAEIGLAEQDARLLGLCVDRGRPVIVGLNKRDLLDDEAAKARTQAARDQLHFAPWAPVVGLSTKSGFGVARLMTQVQVSYEQFCKRISTAELNRFLQETVEIHPPPRSGSRTPRLFFMTQPATSPPIFVVMCSDGEAVREVYRRFLVNQIRQKFGFDSVPVAVRFRSRRRREE
jgi:GTPase